MIVHMIVHMNDHKNKKMLGTILKNPEHSITFKIKCESITVSNIEIKWTNIGAQTNFQISSSLGNGLLPSNAWLAFGFNSQMVI